jgi:hypothetical protein
MLGWVGGLCVCMCRVGRLGGRRLYPMRDRSKELGSEPVSMVTCPEGGGFVCGPSMCNIPYYG